MKKNLLILTIILYSFHSFSQNNTPFKVEQRKKDSYREVQEILHEDDYKYATNQPEPKIQVNPHYLSAYNELKEILSGKKKADIKRAVFITENAFHNNQLSYTAFCNDINKIVEICKLKMQNLKLDYNDKYARAAMLKKFFTDTIKVYSQGKLLYKHYPYTYDFFDYAAETDWTKMFVTKLIQSNSGQCHSLPILFKILAQEMNVDAYLSYAPNHTYIQLKDASGNMYNFETTNGNFGSNSWLMSSGYIKSTAVKKRIYMDTLSLQQTISHCVVDLAMGYKEKHGIDDFALSCCELAIKYHPNNIYAMCLLSDIITISFQQELSLSGNPSPDKLNSYPKLKEMHEIMLSYYDKIEAFGYEEMPQDIYVKWLQSLEDEKNRIESKRLNSQFTINKK